MAGVRVAWYIYLRQECVERARETVMKTITITTDRKDQVVDLTDEIEAFLRAGEKESGVCLIFAAHTTCAVTTADLDPGTDEDLLKAVRALLPKMTYRHPHNSSHAPDHLLSSLIGPSMLVPYAQHRLALGTWQRVVLVELDGPRQRTVYLNTL